MSPFHPLLFAVHPMLFLVAQNVHETTLADAVVPTLISLAGTIAVFGLLWAALGSARKAAVITSIGLLMFFNYGRVYDSFIRDRAIGVFQVGRTLYFLPACGILFLVVAFLVARTRATLDRTTTFLNVASLGLVVLTVFTLFASRMEARASSATVRWDLYVDRQLAQVQVRQQSPPPDIYYLILDGYGRDDVYRIYLDFDNTAFLDSLRSRGFVVTEHSRANYLSTYWSLGSSLNLNYHQVLDEAANVKSMVEEASGPKLLNNLASRILQKAGYRFVFLPSVYAGTSRNPHADLVLSASKLRLTEYERILLRTTVLTVLRAGMAAHRRTIFFDFDRLATIPEIPGPKFTFIHFTVPHPPFNFRADGSAPPGGAKHDLVLPYDEYRRGYLPQLEFVNRRVIQAIDQVLARSKVPPVIVIQGDHGPGYMMPLVTREENRLSMVRSPILNAYHFPGAGASAVYDSISPVNTFRVILNRYCGTRFELLKDLTYDAQPDPANKRRIEFRPVARDEPTPASRLPGLGTPPSGPGRAGVKPAASRDFADYR